MDKEKGFMELLWEAASTEDLRKKETIYDEIVNQEVRRLQDKERHEKETK